LGGVAEPLPGIAEPLPCVAELLPDKMDGWREQLEELGSLEIIGL